MHKCGRSTPNLLRIYEMKLLIGSIDINVLHPALWNSPWFCQCLEEDHNTQKPLISAARVWDRARRLGWTEWKREGRAGVPCGGNQVLPSLGAGVKGSAQSRWWVAMGTHYSMINDNQLWGRRERKQTWEVERESVSQRKSTQSQEPLWCDILKDMWIFFPLARWRNTQTEGLNDSPRVLQPTKTEQ